MYYIIVLEHMYIVHIVHYSLLTIHCILVYYNVYADYANVQTVDCRLYCTMCTIKTDYAKAPGA